MNEPPQQFDWEGAAVYLDIARRAREQGRTKECLAARVMVAVALRLKVPPDPD